MGFNFGCRIVRSGDVCVKVIDVDNVKTHDYLSGLTDFVCRSLS